MLSVRSKLVSLALLAVALTPVARAATATLFPVGFNAGNSLSGEAVGTGATGTTFVLEGKTDGVPVTVTLLEGASELAEGFEVSSIHIAAGCIVSSGSAICQEVISNAGVIATLETVVPFAPFAVEVTSVGAVTTTSASESNPTSASSSASTRNSGSSSTPVKTSTVAPSSATPSSAPASGSASASVPASGSASGSAPASGSASASAPSSAASASGGPSSATAPSIASPIPTPAQTTTASGGSRLSALKMAMALPLAGAFWVLV